MEEIEMKQMLERLLARMDADKAEAKREREADKAESKAERNFPFSPYHSFSATHRVLHPFSLPHLISQQASCVKASAFNRNCSELV
jgi:hypothetical protein